jgi:DNA-binding NtrC family response regulator
VFGHLPGAFAGLQTSSLGLIQAAHGGTIYLSGVEALELESQWKLFRTLEDQAVVPLGGSEGIPVDVRVIASTSVDLPLGVEVGMFRGDLFQMLSTNLVELNGLVDRLEDVPVLADEIVRETASRRKLPAKRFSASAVEWLGRYEWPGNLNELRKAIDVAATCDAEEIDARSLRLALKKVNLPSATFRRRSLSVRFTGFSAMRSSIAARCHA